MSPVRTCVGCGQRSPKAALHRFVLECQHLRLDSEQRAPGRGAYLHAGEECLRRFARAKGPIRSLRSTPAAGERLRLAELLGETVADPR